MAKKIGMSIVLIVFATFLLGSKTIYAEDLFVYEKVQGETDEETIGIIIKEYKATNATTVEIPDEIDGFPVIELGCRLFERHEEIQSITVPDTVKYIDAYCFWECTGLESVTLSENISVIADSTFKGCTSLKKIVIPENVTRIDLEAFLCCEELKEVTLSSKITYIGKNAFTNCEKLEEIDIPDGVGKIEKETFRNCSALKNVDLPADAYEIGEGAFSNCLALTQIKIPCQVRKIDTLAFLMCENLETVTFEVGGDGPYKGKNCLTTIGNSAFYFCKALKNIDFPNNLEVIETSAFYGCAFTQIVLPDSMKIVGDGAFAACSDCVLLTLNEGLERIGENAFDGFVSMTKLNIPSTVTIIGTDAFRCWYGLTSVKIPGGVKVVGKDIFHEDYNLGVIELDCNSPLTANSFGSFSSIVKQHTKKVDMTGGNIFYVCSKCKKTLEKVGQLSKIDVSTLDVSAKTVKIEWTKCIDASGYYVYRSVDGGTYELMKTITNQATVNYVDTTAKTNGARYQYKVIAYKTLNGVVYKGLSGAEKTFYRLSAPKISSAKNSKKGKVTVIWKKNSKASGYELKYTTGKKTKTIKVMGAKTVKKQISSLKKGKKYVILVRAYKKVGRDFYYSDWSAQKKVKIVK